MSETCYSCGLELRDGEPVVHLRDDDGLDWFVHRACMESFEAAEDGPRAEVKA